MNPGSSISNFLLPVIPSMTSRDWEGCWCRKRGRAGLRAHGRLRRGRRFRVSPSPPPPAGTSSPSPGRAELPTGRCTSRCPAVVTKPRAPSLGLSSAGGVPSQGFLQQMRFAQEPWRLDPSAMGLGDPASSDPTFSPVQAGGGVLSTYCLLSLSLCLSVLSRWTSHYPVLQVTFYS